MSQGGEQCSTSCRSHSAHIVSLAPENVPASARQRTRCRGVMGTRPCLALLGCPCTRSHSGLWCMPPCDWCVFGWRLPDEARKLWLGLLSNNRADEYSTRSPASVCLLGVA